MFGWRKRNDGFEWHKYVRTTVVARRAKRKERLEQVGSAAVSGAKNGAEHARNRIGTLFSWFLHWLRGPLASLAVRAWRAFGDLLRPLGNALAGGVVSCSRALTRLMEPVVGWFANRLVSRTLLVIGSLALLAAVVRMPVHGLDRNVLWVLLVAAIALIIWAAANAESVLRLGGRLLPEGVRLRFLQSLGGLGRRLPLAIRPMFATKGLAVLGLLAVIAVGVIGFLLRNGPTLPSLAALSPFTAEPIKGRGRALTGNLIRIGNQVVRLYGVEAPEAGQRCRTRRGRWWRCGGRAKRTLAGLVSGRILTCKVMGHDTTGRVLGRCFAGRRDISGTLLRRGLVFVSADTSATFRKLEAVARKARKGFWGSKVERPSEFRAKRWAAAKSRAPDGCPIKGNVTSRGKVYVLPWSPSYGRIRIQRKRGERWFCSEREAIRAGWRLTSRS